MAVAEVGTARLCGAQFAHLGDFTLESGQGIRDCRLGMLGSGKLVDTSRYFVVAVDALGNAVSTSPSNSERQPQMRFPKITIRDMVNSEYELATKVPSTSRGCCGPTSCICRVIAVLSSTVRPLRSGRPSTRFSAGSGGTVARVRREASLPQ
jgi:hypothetical protein